MAQNKLRIVLGSNGFWKLHVGVEETARTATDGGSPYVGGKRDAMTTDTTSGRIPMPNHWVPRFVSAGVPYEDMRDLLQRIDTWDIWCREWSAKGAAHEQLGEAALTEGRLVTAGQAFHSAAVCYHFAGFRFYEDMSQKHQADRKARECYGKSAPYMRPPAERFSVPFQGETLVCYLRLPVGVSRAPCVITIAGMDSRKEEFHELENEFLYRGMATVSYDGPGQGEVWHHLKMRYDGEKATIAIMDYLAGRPEIDDGRIGIYGWAMGGYVAPRVAAVDRRVKACVSMPIRYKLEDWDGLGSAATGAYQHLFGDVSYEEGRQIAAQFTLEGVLPRVQCPYLIVHGGRGFAVSQSEADQAAREAGGSAKLVVFEEGDHLCLNVRHESWPLMMDWFAEQL